MELSKKMQTNGASVLLFRTLTGMERNLLKRNLSRTEKRIAQGREHVERQRQIVADKLAAAHREWVEELQRKGRHPGRSADLLRLFMETLDAHLDERDRLMSELTH